jgi:hypothetical protein
MDKGFLQFETVTLVPIQTKMLDASLLSDDEVTMNYYFGQKDFSQKPNSVPFAGPVDQCLSRDVPGSGGTGAAGTGAKESVQMAHERDSADRLTLC